MKKKNINKILVCLLAATCSIGLLAGCGNTDNEQSDTVSNQAESSNVAPSDSSASEAESSEEKPEGITYPLATGIKLTYAQTSSKQVVANFKNLGETPFHGYWEEATGVDIEIEEYADYNALNLMIASGDLPDILFYNVNYYTGGPTQMIKDKVVLPLNDYIEYCPDYMEVLNSDDNLLKSVTTPEGDIIGFANVRGSDYMATTCGLMLRQDFLDQVQMEVPSTPDQLYDVLTAFKNELNIEAPMSITLNYLLTHGVKAGVLTSPFDLPKGDFYVEDGKVHYGLSEAEYKDVLTYLNKLYNEKLLDTNFSTVDYKTMQANFMNGISGITMDSPGGGIGTYMSTMADDPTFDITGFGPLVAKEGDIPMSTHYSNPIAGTYALITPACEDPVAAAKFLNYAYTEEGHMLFAFGKEGESYNMVDGYPTYTELVTNNENGWTMQQGLAAYSCSGAQGAFVTDRRYMEQYSSLPQQINAITVWSNSRASEYQMPAVTIAEADSAEYTKLFGDIDTYVSEMFIQYVSGKADLAEFETVYLATLKEMGIDRVIEIQQAAYDEFMSR